MVFSNELNVEKIYDKGDIFLADLLIAITAAENSVYIESYILELPEPGQRILIALEEKQQQGLDIRILVDGFGSLRHIQSLRVWSEKSRVPLRIFNPLPWRPRWRFLFFPVFLLHLIWKIQQFNRRDHRKMAVIDGHLVFLGSINFAKSHFQEFTTRPWFDLSLRARGSAVETLERAFLREFNRTRPLREKVWPQLRRAFRSQPMLFPLTQRLRLNTSFILRFLYWRDLLWRIRRAQRRVFIMNAYFVPHRTLLRSLTVAARRGVNVVILLPSESDVAVVKWFAPMYYKKLIEGGVVIREMQNQMIHTKALLIDDWALVGSNNLNFRSLLHDLEVDAVIEEPARIREFVAIWESKLGMSRVISKSEVRSLSIINRIRYRLVLLIRYFV